MPDDGDADSPHRVIDPLELWTRLEAERARRGEAQGEFSARLMMGEDTYRGLGKGKSTTRGMHRRTLERIVLGATQSQFPSELVAYLTREYIKIWLDFSRQNGYIMKETHSILYGILGTHPKFTPEIHPMTSY